MKIEYHGVDRHAVAERLKIARSRVFRTAADAARALNKKPVTVRAHESGQNGIDVFDLERYARRYGVDIGWLLNGGEDLEPKVEYHVEHGEFIPIFGLIQDGVWLEDDPESAEYPTLAIAPPTHGGQEFTTYADPRFPLQLVEAYRVSTTVVDGPYVDGAVIFCVQTGVIGYKEGDHVVVILDDRKKDIVQWTLRRVARRDGRTFYDPILSDAEPFHLHQFIDQEILIFPRGVVIGSVQRRRVIELALEDRRDLEGYYRPGTAHNPRKPNWQELEAEQNKKIAEEYERITGKRLGE